MAIVLIPSVTMVGASVGAATYLLDSGREARNWAVQLENATVPAVNMVTSVQRERLLTLQTLAGEATAAVQLRESREASDEAVRALFTVGDAMAELDPTIRSTVTAVSSTLQSMPVVRSQVDARIISVREAYTYYNESVVAIATGATLVARIAPNAATSATLSEGATVFRAIEAMARAHALASPALRAHGLDSSDRREFGQQIGFYRTAIDDVAGRLADEPRDRLAVLQSTPAWQNTAAVEESIIAGDYDPARSSLVDLDRWQSDTEQVTTALLDLWRQQNASAQRAAARAGDRSVTNSLIGGASAVLVALATLAIALLLAGRLIGRLKRLQHDTTILADQRLPQMIAELREGHRTDADPATYRLDHGSDEIGSVAEAFNRAQQVAIAAAVAEASTRRGINAVFVNIARRNQVLVYRQLTLLDDAEREVDDPAHLQNLYRLDHLATRARRNAENLIILGGEQPGRRWTTPVSLTDVVRGAVAETVEYTRINVTRLPTVQVPGQIVADLVHLLAELMDNATTFSPPETQVKVTGSTVGRGIALEIIDQGLGMNTADLAERNELLRDPPNFGVTSLITDPRLGLFVVANLASRHKIVVRLRDSAYGGVQAVVVLPLTAVVEDITIVRTTSDYSRPV